MPLPVPHPRPSPPHPAPLAFVAVMWAAAAPPAAAQIATDRPDFVESSLTVGRGSLQVETSVAFQASGRHPTRSAAWSAPTLLRWGLAARWELRLESELVVKDASSPGVPGASGFADLDVGVKWRAAEGRGVRPSSAVLVHAGLPTGSASLRRPALEPSARLVAEWDLPAGLSLGVMPGLALPSDTDGRAASGILGAVVGKELARTLRTFAEVAFPALPLSGVGGTEGVLNTGFAWSRGPHTQIDVTASLGLTKAAPGISFAVGYSRAR